SEVAYVRFASVYRKFQGIRDFVETLDHLKSHAELIGTPIAPTAPSETDARETSASLITHS
ncbi:MAG TPA: transcriptional regulator NrdR, partial [Coleofasciculaceae cyanobacterium]